MSQIVEKALSRNVEESFKRILIPIQMRMTSKICQRIRCPGKIFIKTPRDRQTDKQTDKQTNKQTLGNQTNTR